MAAQRAAAALTTRRSLSISSHGTTPRKHPGAVTPTAFLSLVAASLAASTVRSNTRFSLLVVVLTIPSHPPHTAGRPRQASSEPGAPAALSPPVQQQHQCSYSGGSCSSSKHCNSTSRSDTPSRSGCWSYHSNGLIGIFVGRRLPHAHEHHEREKGRRRGLARAPSRLFPQTAAALSREKAWLGERAVVGRPIRLVRLVRTSHSRLTLALIGRSRRPTQTLGRDVCFFFFTHPCPPCTAATINPPLHLPRRSLSLSSSSFASRPIVHHA